MALSLCWLILHFNQHWWCTYYVLNTKIGVCVKIYLPFRESFNTPWSFCVHNLRTGPTHPLSAQTWLCPFAPFCFTPQGQPKALAACLDVLWLQGSPRVMTGPSGDGQLGSVGCFLTIKLPGQTCDKMQRKWKLWHLPSFPHAWASALDLSLYADSLLCGLGQVSFPFWGSALISWLQLCRILAWRRETAKPGELVEREGGVRWVWNRKGRCWRRRAVI